MVQLLPRSENHGPMPDRGPIGIRLLWTLTSLAFVTSLLRVYVRLRDHKFRWDDVFVICAMTCFISWSVVLTLYTNRGGLEHIDDVAKTGPDNVAIVLFLNWLSQVFGIVGVAAGRISVSALLLGMIKSTELRWQRMFLWLVPITLTALIAMSCLTLASAQCSPANALWDKRVQGKCIDPKVIAGFGTFTGAFDTFADASLAVIPATIFWQLNNTMTEKFQLTIIFVLNILTCIFSGIKTQSFVELGNRTDQAWATHDIFAWATGELFLVIVCSTIPALYFVLHCVRQAAGSIGGNVTTHGSAKPVSKIPSDATVTDTELSDMAFMSVKTRTTIEKGLKRSESADHLVEQGGLPEHGVRVDVMYDVRRDTRPNTACSNGLA
ncbi:hypothetical protein EsDP_00005076 [Epichloe bromicola]|uniref:Rhodopsin domain-containing protein n=1 Tax=Epichloe bromicola TaxID=79588 RepID=A0ABQ0CTL6_9HYPO